MKRFMIPGAAAVATAALSLCLGGGVANAQEAPSVPEPVQVPVLHVVDSLGSSIHHAPESPIPVSDVLSFLSDSLNLVGRDILSPRLTDREAGSLPISLGVQTRALAPSAVAADAGDGIVDVIKTVVPYLATLIPIPVMAVPGAAAGGVLGGLAGLLGGGVAGAVVTALVLGLVVIAVPTFIVATYSLYGVLANWLIGLMPFLAFSLFLFIGGMVFSLLALVLPLGKIFNGVIALALFGLLGAVIFGRVVGTVVGLLMTLPLYLFVIPLQIFVIAIFVLRAIRVAFYLWVLLLPVANVLGAVAGAVLMSIGGALAGGALGGGAGVVAAIVLALIYTFVIAPRLKKNNAPAGNPVPSTKKTKASKKGKKALALQADYALAA